MSPNTLDHAFFPHVCLKHKIKNVIRFCLCNCQLKHDFYSMNETFLYDSKIQATSKKICGNRARQSK